MPVYNSSFARDYITREREPMLPLPDFSAAKGAALVRVAQLARQLRCGWQLLRPETDQAFPCLDCASVDAGNASQIVDEAQAELDALVASMVGG